jgi:hypothetical protein
MRIANASYLTEEQGKKNMADSFNQRMRLIRFRRKRERTKFRDELKLIPGWLVITCVVLYIAALGIAIPVSLHMAPDARFSPELSDQPVLQSFALAGVITVVAVFLSIWLFMLGYVYRDSKRRGMHPGLWTLLVLILSPGYIFIGLIIYLLVREPLAFPCPQCNTTVSARFNFCPNCKYNLHPACPQCQHEVSDNDKFCPYCATELHHSPAHPGSLPATTPGPAGSV